MSEIRQIYSLNSNSTEELNNILSQLSDRLDQMEGYRGSPSVQSSMSMTGNNIQDVADAVNPNDVTNLSQVGSLISAAIGGLPSNKTPTSMAPFAALAAGGATLWTLVDLSSKVPSSAVYIWGYLTLASAAGGIGYIATDSNGNGTMEVSALGAGSQIVPFFGLLTNAQQLYYKVGSLGDTLSITIAGYM